jgi:hypothetical protein
VTRDLNNTITKVLLTALILLTIIADSGCGVLGSRSAKPAHGEDKEDGEATQSSETRDPTKEASRKTRLLFPVRHNGKEGYISQSGEVVIPSQFDAARQFFEGLAAVAIKSGEGSIEQLGESRAPLKWGFIDERGQIVVPLEFHNVGRFSEGLAWVELGAQHGTSRFGVNDHGYIDRTGNVVIAPVYSFLFGPHGIDDGRADFKDGLAVVRAGTKYGYIDKSGRMIIKARFDEATPFSEGLAAVRVGGKYGYIDRTGNMVIELCYDFATSFSDGIALVETENQLSYISRTGEITLRPRYPQPSRFAEGLALVKTDRGLGYINTNGDLTIDIQVGSAGLFSEGMAVVSVDGKFGYVDNTGTMIIKPQFVWAEDFFGGLAKVHPTSMAEYGYIDRTARYVWVPSK